MIKKNTKTVMENMLVKICCNEQFHIKRQYICIIGQYPRQHAACAEARRKRYLGGENSGAPY